MLFRIFEHIQILSDIRASEYPDNQMQEYQPYVIILAINKYIVSGIEIVEILKI